MKNTGLVIGIVILVVLAVLLLGGVGMMGLGGFGMIGPGLMGGLGLGGMLFGGLLMVAFWALVIGGAIWLVVTLARSGQASTTAPQNTGALAAGQIPLDILKVRYAKGEITKEQFEEMKRDLGA